MTITTLHAHVIILDINSEDSFQCCLLADACRTWPLIMRWSTVMSQLSSWPSVSIDQICIMTSSSQHGAVDVLSCHSNCEDDDVEIIDDLDVHMNGIECWMDSTIRDDYKEIFCAPRVGPSVAGSWLQGHAVIGLGGQ